LDKAEFAIIGGTGFEKLFKRLKQTSLTTPYGPVDSVFMLQMSKRRVVFLSRHGLDHSIPPHRINYRANIYALHRMGVEKVLATNAVGSINHEFETGEIVFPSDFIDFTKSRQATFYDEAPVTHVDASQPYCPSIRKSLVENARRLGLHFRERAVMVCTEGPRYETPAEIEMFRRLGCDVVGMTGYPEVMLARELEMCYASVCYVSNKAAGMQQRLTATEIADTSERILPKIAELLTETIESLPLTRRKNCPCANALENARFK